MFLIGRIYSRNGGKRERLQSERCVILLKESSAVIVKAHLSTSVLYAVYAYAAK